MGSPVRLLALDIDGTLLNSEVRITGRTLAALREAHARGMHVALVTGRRHAFALPIAEQIGFDLCLITSNGSVTRSLAGETFHREVLPAADARRVCAHMTGYRDAMVLTFDQETRGALVVERTDQLHRSIGRWMAKNAPWIEQSIPIEDALTRDPIQAMVCGDLARMGPAEARLRDGTLDGLVSLFKTEYPQRDLCILDILPKNCSKGIAVARWAAHLGVAAAEAMAIGDNYNDIEMLAWAGRPVVMGNASEELKALGWPVTATNDEDGVAEALEAMLGETVGRQPATDRPRHGAPGAP